MAKQHDKQFKLDAVQYYFDHKELGVRGCAQNLGVGYSTLTKMAGRISGNVAISLFVAPVITPLMSGKKIPV